MNPPVKTINEGYTAGPEALQEGRVDAWMGFMTNEPTVLELAGLEPPQNVLKYSRNGDGRDAK